MSQTEEYKPTFINTVLLDEVKWSKEQFIRDFSEDWHWNTSLEESAETVNEENMAIHVIDNLMLMVSFMEVPVPNGEAEKTATMNWMWQDAATVVKQHKAHILVIVEGEGEATDKALLLSKAVATLLKQEYSTSVMAHGIVHPSAYYEACRDLLEEDELVSEFHVWIGLSKHEGKFGMYTYGLRLFGKEEMEIYYDPKDVHPKEIDDFLRNMAEYVIESDVTLKDGETAGVSETHFCKISLSEGIALDGNTLKIDYIAN
ncbi:MAG: DUF4261 domain-containing protein [Eubacteriales bacterium]